VSCACRTHLLCTPSCESTECRLVCERVAVKRVPCTGLQEPPLRLRTHCGHYQTLQWRGVAGCSPGQRRAQAARPTLQLCICARWQAGNEGRTSNAATAVAALRMLRQQCSHTRCLERTQHGLRAGGGSAYTVTLLVKGQTGPVSMSPELPKKRSPSTAAARRVPWILQDKAPQRAGPGCQRPAQLLQRASSSQQHVGHEGRPNLTAQSHAPRHRC